MLPASRRFDNIADRVFEQLLNGKFLWQKLDITDLAPW
jgi:hypothetical protein